MYKRRYNNEEISCGCLIYSFIFLFIIGTIINTFTAIDNWTEYTGLNRWIAYIYYYLIVLPIKFIFSPWQYFYVNELTPYDNLNLVLAILNIGVFIIIAIFTYLFIVGLGKKKNPHFTGGTILTIIYFAPFIIWIISLIITWLFS